MLFDLREWECVVDGSGDETAWSLSFWPSTFENKQEMSGQPSGYRLSQLTEVLSLTEDPDALICYTGDRRQRGFVIGGEGVADVLRSLRTLLPADLFTQR
jgi:hypothetical protein